MMSFYTVESVRRGWQLMRASWKPMAAYAAFVWLCNTLVIGPLTLWFLYDLAGYQDVIVGNYTVHMWLLTPRGFAWLLLSGTMVLLGAVFYVAGLFWIARSTAHQKISNMLPALRATIYRLPGLFHISLRLFIVYIPLVLAALVGPGVSYLVFLGEYDINYYLGTQPPEWWMAIGVSSVWIVFWVGVIVWLSVRLLFVYPCWLDGARSYKGALRESWDLSRKRFWELFRLAFFGILAWAGISLLSDWLLFQFTGFLIRTVSGSVHDIVAIICGFFLSSVCADGFIFFVSVSWAVCIAVVCYEIAKPGTAMTRLPAERVQRGQTQKLARLMAAVGGCLALLVVCSVFASGVLLKRDFPKNIPVVIAHRAGPAYAPENTLIALEKVLEAKKSDIVEIDVQLSADSVVVVSHDKDLMKTAGDERVIGQTVWEELATVDVGRLGGPEFEGQMLPRLDNFLERTRGRVPLMIEFKYSAGTNLVERTIEVVKDAKMVDEVILMSLEIGDIRDIQRMAPEMEVGYFASVELGDLRKLDVDFIGLKDYMATRERIRDLHKVGIEVYAWTIDDPMRMVELIELGIDGIITNDPTLAAETIDSYERLPASYRVLLKYRNFWDAIQDSEAVGGSYR